MSRRSCLRWVAVAVLVMGLMLAARVSDAEPLRAIRVKDRGHLADPQAAFWKQAPAVKVTLLPQMIAFPAQPNVSVTSLSVKAAHNEQWLAILLEWKDLTKNDRIVLDKFGDQAAVELPIHFSKEAMSSPMMGNPGGRVTIWQWRAAFQHDTDKGEPTVRDLYPNAVVDIYPDQVLKAIDARPYTGALGLDNPTSRHKQSPVLDQMAEGWGTMTVHTDQKADGKGVWRDGAWRVVITHPLVGVSENQPRLSPGDDTVIAFAVWDGGNREVGARKAWSNWIPFRLAR
ncbi:Chlorate reductase subunit gamma precursor [Candidatus Methylomirabilis lanthanidiphila]|uniref:Chlorate reductase subunit gamma n=1 Tax=Candidatus Methylomirabilis lanthanidiphila TaxID=2211376 RepID=A0A564ZG14_9BACT|nr:hypothetical protein [Candidatus Methylomirabilis lanthanidiphila]VUZ84259.1 Chlorate reductase subunit gamma precursor [Candidatus Methylomirabilis lanthanidiphila]